MNAKCMMCPVLWVVAACPLLFVSHGSAAERPNIIYIMLDDAGYGDFGAFGSKQVRTPAFDRMCREGMKFTQHYSGSAVCAPTRCVLMTGLDTGHCRRRDNRAKANTRESSKDRSARPALVFLKDEDITVAESLKQAGYVTGGIGKWGLGNPGSSGVPNKQGFDHWYGYLDQVHAHDHYTDQLWRDDRMEKILGNAGGKQKTYAHDLFEKETLDFIDRYRDKPFFLYLAYTVPHGKYVIPHDDPAYKLYADQPWSQQVRNYAAMITRADQTVDKILTRLKELKIDDNTIVFYTSDNGPNAPFVKPLNSAGGLRGIKRSLYEGGIRAAMTVRWPGSVPAGDTSEYVWGMRDFFPTACALADVDAPDNLSGISVVPALLGKEQPARSHLYWEYHSPFQQAVRQGNWKAIRFGTKEPTRLYDLSTDLGEQQDVAAAHKEIAAKLARIMDTERVDTPDWPARKHAAKKTPKRKGRKKTK